MGKEVSPCARCQALAELKGWQLSWVEDMEQELEADPDSLVKETPNSTLPLQLSVSKRLQPEPPKERLTEHKRGRSPFRKLPSARHARRVQRKPEKSSLECTVDYGRRVEFRGALEALANG